MEQSNEIRFGILTVSDRCYAGQAEDTSGSNLECLVKSKYGVVSVRETVSDDVPLIKAALLEMVENCDVILTTGGTGFAARDVTPEATRLVIEREAPGMSVAMMTTSLAITKLAMLSRGICGICKETLILNLPGSKKASAECFESVAMSIPHAVALLRGRDTQVESVHKVVQAAAPHSHKQAAVAQIQEQPGATLKHHHHHHHHHHGQGDSKVDIGLVARRPRSSPYPCVPVDDAVAIVMSHCYELGVETVPFHKALGRVLAEDVFALDALPPFPASIKDGYAVIASDGAGRRLVSPHDSHAGKKPSDQDHLASGSCVRINTGAPVPPGADAVVQVEDTQLAVEADGGRVELAVDVLVAPMVGLDIREHCNGVHLPDRPPGSDIQEGQRVLAKGCLLGSSDLGLLATVGVPNVLVYRLPTVALLSTGNELQEPTLPLAPGRIRDSNKTTLQALLAENHMPAIDVGITTDDPATTLSKLREALDAGDVVVTTGGVSMGDRDVLKQVLLTDLGAEIHFGRVLMKPGKPATFATCVHGGKKRLVFCLPGNPVSATVTCHLFVLPALRKISGHSAPAATVVTAAISEPIDLDPRPEYQRATLSWLPGNPVPIALTTGDQISSRLLSFASANCVLALPPRSQQQTSLAMGSLVSAVLLNRL